MARSFPDLAFCTTATALIAALVTVGNAVPVAGIRIHHDHDSSLVSLDSKAIERISEENLPSCNLTCILKNLKSRTTKTIATLLNIDTSSLSENVRPETPEGALQNAVRVTCKLYHTYSGIEKYQHLLERRQNISLVKRIMQINVEDSCQLLNQRQKPLKIKGCRNAGPLTCDLKDGSESKTFKKLQILCNNFDVHSRVTRIIEQIRVF